jgi:hypothetical protein
MRNGCDFRIRLGQVARFHSAAGGWKMGRYCFAVHVAGSESLSRAEARLKGCIGVCHERITRDVAKLCPGATKG